MALLFAVQVGHAFTDAVPAAAAAAVVAAWEEMAAWLAENSEDRRLNSVTPRVIYGDDHRRDWHALDSTDAEDALAWVADREWLARAAVEGGSVSLDPAGLPRELRRRLVERAVATVRAAHGLSPDWRETGLEPLLAALDAGGSGTIAEVLARTRAAIWHFALAPPRRSH